MRNKERSRHKKVDSARNVELNWLLLGRNKSPKSGNLRNYFVRRKKGVEQPEKRRESESYATKVMYEPVDKVENGRVHVPIRTRRQSKEIQANK